MITIDIIRRGSADFLVIIFLFFGCCVVCSSSEVRSVSAVSTKIIAIDIVEGRIERASQEPYVHDKNDVIKEIPPTNSLQLLRGGKSIGFLVGSDRALLAPDSRFYPSQLEIAVLASPASILASVNNGKLLPPLKVWRKSRPIDSAFVNGVRVFVLNHTLYLELNGELKYADSVKIKFLSGGLDDIVYRHIPSNNLTEAIHVNQVGFRSDDTYKAGFLSCWLGEGGVLAYTKPPKFSIVDQKTGNAVYSGIGILSKASSDQDEDGRNINYSKTDVWRLDFPDLKDEGEYKLVVDEIGCSRRFIIARDSWQKALSTALSGIYHQRSGIAIGPPYSDFVRPRPMHPDDGMQVFSTRASIRETRNGGARNTDNFSAVNAGATDEVVTNAWGGYHDAADWDRQISHLEIARNLFELYELFPSSAKLDLNIPESGGLLPDILDEACWGIDFFLRLQTHDGGIRGGIESQEHPRRGEGSWQESQKLYAYRPDAASSYEYAAAATWAAYLIAPFDASRAKQYTDSALRAFEWAEKQSVENKTPAARDGRNFSALQFYRLTGDKNWLSIYNETNLITSDDKALSVWGEYNQTDAAFLYARMPAEGLDSQLRDRIVQALRKDAQQHLKMVQKTGFGWTKSGQNSPIQWGRVTKPEMINVLRLHSLTKDPALISLAISASQFGLGANPSNLVYTTGLGSNPVKHPIHCDSTALNVPVPAGIFMMGLYDMSTIKEGQFKWIIDPLRKAVYPELEKWPVLEASWDIGAWPQMNEYVTNQIAQNAYVWGYLALRPREQPTRTSPTIKSK